MELDLNPELLDKTHSSEIGCDSIVGELESTNGHIEERIRHLEAVTSRARQHQSWRPVHSPIHITNFAVDLSTDNVQDEGRVHQEEVEVGVAVEGRISESEKGGKGRSTHLIAKALEMETYTSKVEGSPGHFYDCNIWLDMARDPVLTCCAHLFCWPCFYVLTYAYSNAREWPVCEGEVTETGIIPIYGNASVSRSCQLELKEAGLSLPPQPHALRIESSRRQLISQGASLPMIQNTRQFNNLIGGLGDQLQFEFENPSTATCRTIVFVAQSCLETENNQHTRSH